MKRIFYLLIVISLIFCGCTNNSNDNVKEKPPITINMPRDDTVNGYRNQDNDMPDEIDAQNVLPQGNTDVTISYCGNKNSKKFHKITCSSLKNTKDENKVFLATKEDYLSKGYLPCKKCNP